MREIDNIRNMYDFLTKLCVLTKEPISLNDEKLRPFKFKLKKYFNHLKDFGFLGKQDGINWIAPAPTLELAYNFYYSMQNSTKNFADVQEILEGRLSCSHVMLMDALAIDIFYKELYGTSLVTMQTEELPVQEPIEFESTITMGLEEYEKLRNQITELTTANQGLQNKCTVLELKQFAANNQVTSNTEFREYLVTITKFLGAISKDTVNIEPTKNSVRKVIATAISIQRNVVCQAILFDAILIEMRHNLDTIPQDESIAERKQNLEVAIKVAKELIGQNNSNPYIF